LSIIETQALVAQTTINFDNAENWVAGSVALGSYAKDHTYTESGVTFTGGPALRNTTTTQDEVSGALGTYSWRLSNTIPMEWVVTVGSGGVSDFSFKIRRWNTTPSPNFNLDYSIDEGANWKNVTVINNDSLNNSSNWATIDGTINNANERIKIRIIGNGNSQRIMVDDFTWAPYTAGTITPPSSLTSKSASSSQINLECVKNTSSNDLLVAWSDNGIFGDPVQGTTYTKGSAIEGGGTVLSSGTESTIQHTGLNKHSVYYYKAWSLNSSNNYSKGITTNASTLGLTPDNAVSDFTVESATHSRVNLNWQYNQGINTADSFLLVINTSNSIPNPINGIWLPNDFDLSDGNGCVNLNSDLSSYQWTDLNPETHYNFAIYAYSNSGANVLYKIESTPTECSIVTNPLPPLPTVWFNEFHYDNEGEDTDEMIEIVLKNSLLYDLSDFEIILYNGGDGLEYATHALNTFTKGSTIGDFTFYYKLIGGIQNGPTDGFAIAYQNILVEGSFISYEGTFSAKDGPAKDSLSLGLEIDQAILDIAGSTLQLTGNGVIFSDFIWSKALATHGKINEGQTLGNFVDSYNIQEDCLSYYVKNKKLFLHSNIKSHLSIRIYDTYGRKKFETKIQTDGSVDMTSFNGICIIEINNGHSTKVLRAIIE